MRQLFSSIPGQVLDFMVVMIGNVSFVNNLRKLSSPTNFMEEE